MSIQHVAAVLYHMPELREQSAAFALAAIADSADRASGWSFHIPIKAIAEAARLKIRATQYALRELERRGYLKTEGKPGRTCRFRLLFDTSGKRKPESELYATPASNAGVKKRGGAPVAPRGALNAPGGARNDNLLNNPLIGRSVSYPSSVQKTEQKLATPRPKKIPGPSETESQRRDRIEDERKRQLAALGARP